VVGRGPDAASSSLLPLTFDVIVPSSIVLTIDERSFLMASRRIFLYNAKTSFWIPDFADDMTALIMYGMLVDAKE
jgi:hypothetical protein